MKDVLFQFSNPIMKSNDELSSASGITPWFPRSLKNRTKFLTFQTLKHSILLNLRWRGGKANVILDGKNIGLTPMKKELLAKTYLLRMVKWGYTPYEMELEIKKMELSNFKIDLSKERNWKTLIRSTVIFVALSYLLKSI